MAAGKVKNENYVTIQGWMINDLQLSGNELVAYGVIYGFTQADGQYMTCSQEYISNWCNISRESTNRLLKRLEKKNLIVKENGIRCCKYRAVRPCDETSQVCEETSQTCEDTSQMCEETSPNCEETAHNNYIYNKSITNTYNSNHINSVDDLMRLESEIRDMIAIDLIEDVADNALIENLINVMISDVFSIDDQATINVNSVNKPDNKPAFLVKNIIRKNLNYGTVTSYLRQVKEYGKPIKSTQYIVKALYRTCLNSQTVAQSNDGYIRY